MKADDVYNFKVGDVINNKGNIGVVRFIGQVEFDSGIWIGFELSRPVGKCDGSVRGTILLLLFLFYLYC